MYVLPTLFNIDIRVEELVFIFFDLIKNKIESLVLINNNMIFYLGILLAQWRRHNFLKGGIKKQHS